MDFAPSWLPPAAEVEMAVKYVDRHGKQRVKGGKHLKGSQSYPVPFPCSRSWWCDVLVFASENQLGWRASCLFCFWWYQISKHQWTSSFNNLHQKHPKVNKIIAIVLLPSSSLGTIRTPAKVRTFPEPAAIRHCKSTSKGCSCNSETELEGLSQSETKY